MCYHNVQNHNFYLKRDVTATSKQQQLHITVRKLNLTKKTKKKQQTNLHNIIKLI